MIDEQVVVNTKYTDGTRRQDVFEEDKLAWVVFYSENIIFSAIDYKVCDCD